MIYAGNRENPDLSKVASLEYLAGRILDVSSRRRREDKFDEHSSTVEVFSGKPGKKLHSLFERDVRRIAVISEKPDIEELHHKVLADPPAFTMEELEEEMHELCERDKVADQKLEYMEKFKRKIERKRQKVEAKENLVKNVKIRETSSDSEDEPQNSKIVPHCSITNIDKQINSQASVSKFIK